MGRRLWRPRLNTAIRDVSDATFDSDVVEASRSAPVIVDFWAAWCGPCRALGPVIEDVVRRADDVTLAKLDVDANPQVAMRFGIRGIPAVKAFVDGRVVDEFVGLQSRAFVERFVGQLASPAAPVELPQDEPGLRALLELEPDNVEARRLLGRQLLAHGRLDDADAVLAVAAHDRVSEGLRARIELQRHDHSALPASLANPDGASELAAVSDVIAAIAGTEGETRSALRRVAVGVLAENASDPQVDRLRAELASALF